MLKVGSVTAVDASGYIVGPQYGYTLTQLETAAINGTLIAGATYLISDFGLLAIASSTTSYIILDNMFGSFSRRWWRPQGAATAAPTITGIAAATGLGTSTSRALASTNRVTKHPRFGYVSAATAGNLAGQHWAAATQLYTDTGFIMTYRFSFTDAATVSGARAFVGIGTNTNSPTNVEPSTLTNLVGIGQLSSSTNMHVIYGGSAAQTPIDMGSNFPAASLGVDLYELIIARPPGTGNTYTIIVRRYNGTTLGPLYRYTTTLGTSSTVVPASGSIHIPRAWRCNNATALAVGIDILSLDLTIWD